VNQPIDSWSSSTVTNIERMFYNVSVFNQPAFRKVGSLWLAVGLNFVGVEVALLEEVLRPLDNCQCVLPPTFNFRLCQGGLNRGSVERRP